MKHVKSNGKNRYFYKEYTFVESPCITIDDYGNVVTSWKSWEIIRPFPCSDFSSLGYGETLKDCKEIVNEHIKTLQ